MKIHLTKTGAERLQGELDSLRANDRPTIIQAISEAREHGDLSENAEYHSAKEKQSFIEGRIKELEAVLGQAEIIDPSKLSGGVKFGATVKIVDEETEATKTLQLVGEYEADIERGHLNIQSPLARALVGKEVGDSVSFKTPGGEKFYEILEVEFK